MVANDQSSSDTSSGTSSIFGGFGGLGINEVPSIWQLYPTSLLNQTLPCLELMDICLFPNCNEDTVGNDLPDAFENLWKFDTIDPQSYGSREQSFEYQTGSEEDGTFLEGSLTPTESVSDAEWRPILSAYDTVEDDTSSQHDSYQKRLPDSPTIDDLITYVRHFSGFMTQKECHIPSIHSRLKSPGGGNLAGVAAVVLSQLENGSQLYENNQTITNQPMQREQEQFARKFVSRPVTLPSEFAQLIAFVGYFRAIG